MSGWKTFIFNGTIGFVLMLAELASWTSAFDWRQVVDAHTAIRIVLFVNIANIVLRSVTKTPMFKKR